MGKFIAREKMSRKARKKLDSKRRVTWGISPVTRKVTSKKVYSRKRRSNDFMIDGSALFVALRRRRSL